MGGGGYNKSIFTYETLVHAMSGAAVSTRGLHELRTTLMSYVLFTATG